MSRRSVVESAILALLAKGEMYGLQIVERSNGVIPRGSVYVTLGRMERKGLVESRQEDRAPGTSGIARRFYRRAVLS